MTAAVLAATLGATGSTAQPGSQNAAQREQQAQQAKLAKALEGLTPGKPTHCIDPDLVNYTRNFDDTILYVRGRDRLWRTTTNGCSGLKNDDIVVSRRTMSQICSGDIIETHSRSGGFLTGACSLGEFVPYTKGK
jgi:hypothetical protein